MKQAADFKLQDQDGLTRTLSDYRGRWLVIYFYPKDNTPGCTTEACTFRDKRDAIADMGKAEVIGVSTDSVQSHKKFADKHHLNFTLLSDRDHVMIEAYGSWKPKTFMGRKYMGIERNTFIISPEGQIVKEYYGVNPSGHAVQIMTDLKQLQAA